MSRFKINQVNLAKLRGDDKIVTPLRGSAVQKEGKDGA